MSGRAVPKPTPGTSPYWDAASRGQLRLQWCRDCEKFYFYPRSSCPSCGGTDIEWKAVTGRGKLHTYLINNRPGPGFDEPYAIAVVELEEGPRMMSNIVGVPNTPEHLKLDMALQVTFEQRGDISLPVFKPASAP